MEIANRDVSIYEVLHGHRARWYWDRRYITEAMQDAHMPPLSEAQALRIDRALSKRYARAYEVWKTEGYIWKTNS